jgi:hypothetical protein
MNRAIIVLALGLLVFAGSWLVAGNRTQYIPLHETSRLKEYNPKAEWRKVPCQHCDGKGFRVKVCNDFKRNRTIRYLVPCPYCKGKGYSGMSKM